MTSPLEVQKRDSYQPEALPKDQDLAQDPLKDQPPTAKATSEPVEHPSSPKLRSKFTPDTPELTRRDPSLPSPAPAASKPVIDEEHTDKPPESWSKSCGKYLYNKEERTFCDRTCCSWISIISYAIMYLIFLTSYSMIFIYITLYFVKNNTFDKFEEQPLISLLTYSSDNVGLTGVPLSEHNYPLIWYRTGEVTDYNRYVTALDELLTKKRVKRDVGSNLGPCGQRPYGYGEKPCILVKINKQLNWAGIPLKPGSPKAMKAPEEVQNWIQKDSNKLWLHCTGYHRYDKEHIGRIKYYPDPPGFDSSLYPLKMNSSSPVVAFQVSDFTLGISIAIECKLWFENGASSVSFMLYVSPKRHYLRNISRWY